MELSSSSTSIFSLIITIRFDDLIVGLGHLGHLHPSFIGHLSEGLDSAQSQQLLDFPLGLKGAHHLLILPADLVRETAQAAVLAAGLQAQQPHASRHDHLLSSVVGGWAAVIGLQPTEGLLSALGLVGQHT